MREIANSQPMPMFCKTDAVDLIKEMRELYGDKFEWQWQAIQPRSRLAEKFIEVLGDLPPAAIQNGIKRMHREPRVPTLPEFRMWCEQGGAWLTADEAWANALMHQEDSNTPITEQAYAALRRVTLIINNEGQKAAARAFKDIYQRIVSNCQSKGMAQSQYQPVKLETKQEEVKAVPIPDNILAQLKTGFKRVNP
jgi:hypothetical protein